MSVIENLWCWTAFLLIGLCGCAAPTGMQSPPTPDAAGQTYESLHRELDKGGDFIDYDTLMDVYARMTNTPEPIPHTDALIHTLISQHNPDGRVDQMILIFSAQIIGNSKYPVSNAGELFDAMLHQEGCRMSEWVISFIADAIGTYRVDLENGDQLADLMEERLEQVRARPQDACEYFGSHFLPPPKTELIQSYFSGLADRLTRQKERRFYYLMIHKGIPENAIAAGLRHLQMRSLPSTGDAESSLPMAYLFLNWSRLPEEVRQTEK